MLSRRLRMHMRALLTEDAWQAILCWGGCLQFCFRECVGSSRLDLPRRHGRSWCDVDGRGGLPKLEWVVVDRRRWSP